jgi:ABC-type sulfate transport system substrate-binding protein
MKELLIDRIKNGSWRRYENWILSMLLLAVALYFGGRTMLVSARAPVRLVVYAFSTQEEAFTQGIFPAFEQQWEKETGRDLNIEAVFGPSGTLAGQINLGAPADVALFSNEQQVTWLKVGRRVWAHTQPVVFGWTPMVIVTRPGNPAGIAEFADLAQPGIRLLHPDPRSSGAGEWAVLAEYGSMLMDSGDYRAAEAQLETIWRNVRLLAPSARAALTLFELGAGDATITYEQDARLAQERGVSLDIVTPSRTIVAVHVAVVVDDNLSPTQRPVAQAFIDFLTSDPGQQILDRYHTRPADLKRNAYPVPPQRFSVEDLGGWSRAYTDVVEAVWRTKIEPDLALGSVPRFMDEGESQ